MPPRVVVASNTEPTAQWHADRTAMRPKPAKLLMNPVLREYVQGRLAGKIATPGGKSIAGPQVEWKGRRHGPRQARRWSQAWSPEQIANRLLMDFPEDTSMRISHEAIYRRCTCRAAEHCAGS